MEELKDVNLLYQLNSKLSNHQRDFHLKYIPDVLLLHLAQFLFI